MSNSPILPIATVLCCLLSPSPFVQAATLHVPGDFATIQPALDAAAVGDTVMVEPGTYRGAENRNLSFHGKDLVLVSVAGATQTVIDCEGGAHGIRLDSGETRSALIEGFFVTGADSRDIGGGVVFAQGASPTLRACIVAGNRTDFYGAGIYVSTGAPRIEDCVIRANRAVGPTGRGGGILCSSAEAEIHSCLIEGNFARQSGGGVYCWAASPTLSACVIRDNETGIRGGGVYCKVDSAPSFENCLILDNRTAYGGAAYCYVNSTPLFRNCTITGNRAATGGGIFCHVTSSPTINSCILRDNQPEEIIVSGAEPTILYSNVQGGWAGEGNTDLDARFLTRHGWERLLAPASPCVDAGDPTREDAIYDSHPRWPDFYQNGARSDMGAYGGPGNRAWIQYQPGFD